MIDHANPLVVTHVVSGDLWAGAEVQVYNLCVALKDSPNITLTAVVFNEGILSKNLSALGIKVKLVDEKRLNALQIVLAIRDHCRDCRTRILHTHGFKENILGIIGKDLAHVPYSIRTVHGNPETAFTFKSPHKWLIQKLDTAMSRIRQRAVIAVSTQLEETLRPLYPGRVQKIFNFIDIESIRNQNPKPQNLEKDMHKIGIVGRLVPVKRIDIFIHTIALLNRQEFDCTGVIIGDGPLEKELKALADNLGMANKIEFRGFVNPAYKDLQSLSVLLMTSDHEGLPMTLLEALALEVPIVAHRVGGIPEVLDHGKCGWLVDDHDPRAYAEITAKALRSSEETTQKAQRGLERAHQVFGMIPNAKKYEELYTQ